MAESQTNLIINYLPQTLTDEEFRSMFESIGAVKSTKIVRDRATGYSYGFGFVEYAKDKDAERAIQTLNGLQLQNKRIKVAFSRPGEKVKGANLYVRNLPADMDEDGLRDLFDNNGTIVQCRVLRDVNTGKSKRVGFVLYDSYDEATAAIESMDGFVLPGTNEPINVKRAEDNKGKARPPAMAPQQIPQRLGTVNGGGFRAAGGYSGGGYGGGRGGYGGGGYGGGAMRNQGQARFNRYSPMNSGAGYSGGAAAATSEDGSDGFVLFVYNIGSQTDERGLWQLFSPFGNIQKVNVIRDHSKNQTKGYGFVTMTNYHDAMSAIQGLNGYTYAEHPLQVSFKSNKA